MTRYTEAQARAIKKYLGSIEEAKVRAPAEDMGRYRKEAKKAGLSLNKFFVEAVEEKISRTK